jgi:nucleoside-diphosphate-sugar epimerase
MPVSGSGTRPGELGGMRVFLAGAGGAIGSVLVPRLIEAGHDVTGTTRTAGRVSRLGAHEVRLDVFDAGAVRSAVAAAEPDVVIHQLTALSEFSLADNARIRIEGTRNLVDAALAAGVRRMVAQSIAWAYEPGAGPATESTPLDSDPAEPRATTVRGVRVLEETVAELPEHVILRYGLLYGPGTFYAPGGRIEAGLRAGTLPATDGVSSFVHVVDAAQAAVAALDWPSGPVNIVDDEPAPGLSWLPALAEALGTPAPASGSGHAGWERGADNSLARELGWRPTFPSWRTGFRASRTGPW